MSESLRAYIAAHGLDQVAVMNELQDHGKCSDNAVWACDVANGGQCLTWLLSRDLRPLRARKEAA
jgi:hypothetical protein